MSVTRLVLKIVALSLVAVAIVCTIIAYWDKLLELTTLGKNTAFDCMAVSEEDDFEEL